MAGSIFFRVEKAIVFSGRYNYRIFMKQKLFSLMLPFFLTGCVGAIFTGQTEYLDECYPDIRTVPERKAALCPRGLHEKEEKVSRAADFKQLSQDWEKITARDQALREKLFPPKE